MTDQHAALVALVSEGGELDHVARAALRLARERAARLIFYDRDAASVLNDPLPNAWSSQGERELYGDPLTPEELVKLGREPLARRVAAARAEGVDAWGWLPSQHGTAPLAAYAREHGAGTVLIPAELDEPGLADRLKGETAGQAVEAAAGDDGHLAVVLVHEDGSTIQADGFL